MLAPVKTLQVEFFFHWQRLNSGKLCKKIIQHLRDRGLGVLITDHNVRETLAICEKAYIVGGGHIIAEGSAEEILANQQVKDVYLGHDFKL